MKNKFWWNILAFSFAFSLSIRSINKELSLHWSSASVVSRVKEIPSRKWTDGLKGSAQERDRERVKSGSALLFSGGCSSISHLHTSPRWKKRKPFRPHAGGLTNKMLRSSSKMMAPSLRINLAFRERDPVFKVSWDFEIILLDLPLLQTVHNKLSCTEGFLTLLDEQCKVCNWWLSGDQNKGFKTPVL